MSKIEFVTLWDLYNGLLTPTQQEITNEYFNLDLTISEIAESKGITRQGVSECLNTCKKQLKEYEEKLGHGKLISAEQRLSQRLACVDADINVWADAFLKLHPEYAADIESLKGILQKNYGEEGAQEKL
jgi:hypothetical protein